MIKRKFSEKINVFLFKFYTLVLASIVVSFQNGRSLDSARSVLRFGCSACRHAEALHLTSLASNSLFTSIFKSQHLRF